jgi:hypothetical protein
MFVIKSFQDQEIIQLYLIYEQYKDEYLMYIVYFYSNGMNERKLKAEYVTRWMIENQD